MNIKDYMEEVVKECDDLKLTRELNSTVVLNNEGNLVLSKSGNCNYEMWNNGWLKENIKEFNEAGYIDLVYVQELFPNPKDFVKFYKKVCKEIENEIRTTHI